MIKVAMVAHLGELSGAGTALIDKAVNISREQFEPILILPEDSELADLARCRGLAPHIISNPQTAMVDTHSIIAKIKILSERRAYVQRLRRFFKQNNIDLVFVNSTASIFPGIAAKKAGLPILWMVHEVLENPSLSTRVKMAYIRRNANSIVWDSNLGKELFPPAPNTPSLVCPNFVDTNRFQPKQTEFSASGAPLTILCNGPFPRKGADVFLNAAKRVAATTQRPCAFVLIGPEMPQHADFCKNLHDIAQQPELKGKVTFAGIQKDVPTLLRNADIFVSASRNEAYPIIVLEAMAAKTPIICTDVGDCAIIVGKNNERGALVPPENPDRIAEAILDAIDHPQQTQQRAQKALDWILESYSGNKCWKPLEELMLKTAARA